jgi:PAS domain S-box-containing protein
LTGEKITGIETRRRTRDGDVIDVRISAAPLCDGDGDVTGAVGFVRTVSENA